MQDNEPLMRALSSLIVTNEPDLVLFVGEALVGNDAVDQLSKFKSRLADLAAGPGVPHTVDGIVLTKMDAIDDKARRRRRPPPSTNWLLVQQIPRLCEIVSSIAHNSAS